MATLCYLDHLLLLVKTKVILDLLMGRLLCTMSCLSCFANLGVGHLLKEALESSGFNGIQDVLVMNQAERDMLTFLSAMMLLLLCQVTRSRCSKAEFNQFTSSAACYRAIKKMTFPSSSKLTSLDLILLLCQRM